jgi:hypothetical protein
MPPPLSNTDTFRSCALYLAQLRDPVRISAIAARHRRTIARIDRAVERKSKLLSAFLACAAWNLEAEPTAQQVFRAHKFLLKAIRKIRQENRLHLPNAPTTDTTFPGETRRDSPKPEHTNNTQTTTTTPDTYDNVDQHQHQHQPGLFD